jgi:hypothetical protein
MSIKKSLLALAVTAIAMMGFASSAMAVDGVVRDAETEEEIPANRELHFIGHAEFSLAGVGGMDCDATSIAKMTTGSTGHVTNFSVPIAEHCEGTGSAGACELEGAVTVTNLSYHFRATPTDFDVTGNIVTHYQFKTNVLCPFSGEEVTLTFSSITLKPLKTGTIPITGTNAHLGMTAASGEPIAGVEIEGLGSIDRPMGPFAVTAGGKLELTPEDRCTWKLVSS